MNKFFDSTFHHALNGIFDLIVMNILFIICCVPIFTIGAALVALNSSTYSLSRGSSFSIKQFFLSFKIGLKTGTIMFLSGSIGIAMLIIDLWIISSKIQGFAKYPILGIIFFLIIVLFFTLSYYFPIASIPNERSLKENLLISTFFSFKNLPRSIVICALNLSPIVIFLLWPYLFMISLIFWLLIGFALLSYVTSILLQSTFQILANNCDS